MVTPEDVHGGQVRRVSNTHENYFGSTFPNLDNTDIVVDLGIDEYLAMSFVYQPHPVAANGASRLASLQANVTYGVPVVSTLTVSPCPGDFSVESQTVAEHCVAALDHAYGTFYFSPPGVGFPFCELEPGATYYINIIHTDDYLNELPYCQTVRNGRCALYMRQFGF